jgi:hypothetical protein
MFETEDQQAPQDQAKSWREPIAQDELMSESNDEANYVKAPRRPDREGGILSAGVSISEISDCEAPMAESCGPSKIRQISIREVNRGYIVEVGCHTFAFSTPDELADKISAYLKDPNGVERKWFNGELF